MNLFRLFLVTSCAATLVACGAKEAPRASAAQITKIALSDVPESVTNLVSTTQPDFEMTEVIKKLRDGRVYYDVEGELPSGDEIEFDVLMTKSGPEIVEIQRDLIWSDVPQNARDVVDNANTDNLGIARIIESFQPADGSIIYEVFVANHPSDPKFEVRVKDGAAKLLPSRWKH